MVKETMVVMEMVMGQGLDSHCQGGYPGAKEWLSGDCTARGMLGFLRVCNPCSSMLSSPVLSPERGHSRTTY